MRLRIMWLAALACVLVPLALQAAEFKEKWVYASTSIADEEGLERTLGLMRDAKACGCTHIQLNDGTMRRLATATPEYLANVKTVLDEAKKLEMTVVPGVYAIGYSGGYLSLDPSLAEGIPVRKMPYVIKDGKGLPAPALNLTVANAGFEKSADGGLADWSEPTLAGFISVDTAQKHSGNASLKVTNLDKLPKDSGGEVYISQKLKVKPFQFYVISVWTRNEDIKATDESYIVVTSLDGKRRNGYTNLRVRPNESTSAELRFGQGGPRRLAESTDVQRPRPKPDWVRHVTMFNTLEASEITFAVGVSEAESGTIWFDDLEIAPAGLLNVVRRELTPLVVTNEDGSVTYEEGKDFESIPAADLQTINRRLITPAAFTLTADSKIKDGQTVLVSFFHTVVIYDSQLVISIEDPKVFDIMDNQMKYMTQIWPTGSYFMNYDEMRIGGWENQPGGAHLTPGELLAKHVARGVEIIRKYDEDATIYIWSDMFSPYHNARPFSTKGYYYLVNGNWDGGWEGLPKDVIIANWYAPSHESMMFFADRGYTQFMCGYYDGDVKANIRDWMKVSEGVPNVVGMMYTTWHRNYKDMPEFFRLLKEYPAWLDSESTESSLKEK